MMSLAFAVCPKGRRRLVKLRTVGGGLLILIVFALIVLRTPANRLFLLANDGVDRLLAFSRDGAGFVFGRLATDPQSFGVIFAFQVLPTILFFSALMSLVYHLRVMPFVIEKMGRFLSRARDERRRNLLHNCGRVRRADRSAAGDQALFG